MTHPQGKILLSICISLLILALLSYPTWAQDELPPPGQPLTLDQCITIALKFQPSLRGSAASIEAAKARVEQALSAYYPQVNWNTSYSTTTLNYGVGSSAGNVISSGSSGRNRYSGVFTDVSASQIALNQTLYDFGRTANAVRVNRENTAASEGDFSITRQAVILNVQQAYYSVLQTLRLVQVAEDTVDQNQKRLEQAQGSYQAGTRPKIDVTNAEVNMANAELSLIITRNNYQVARATLNNALGLRQDLNFAIIDSLAFKRREITSSRT
ncbi:MAG: TolC family protein [Deltaproteobacteria bacterium]|nr:TolC family protein [Deltaproteobacteria bacterium]